MKGIYPILLILASAVAFIPNKADGQSKSRPSIVRQFNNDELPAPQGMVYIPGGSILISFGAKADSGNTRKYSLSPFFIDKAEVTNKQYREFVNWVIDSMAVAQYLKDGKYYSIRQRDSAHKLLDWKKISHNEFFLKEGSAVRKKLNAMFKDNEIKRELYLYEYTYQKLVGPPGNGKKVKTTEIINVYPNTDVWASDFPNSQTDMMVDQYFKSPAFDDYPVVGVSWKQACAYANWKTLTDKRRTVSFMRDFKAPYTLPSEAQWIHAAIGQIKGDSMLSDIRLFNSKEVLDVNFKQDEGNYTDDGASYTVPVMSYAPNKWGLYNMLGNVNEWLLDAYNASAYAFAHDQNPVILYDADSTDPTIMKSKLVRGGSWKDAASSLDPYVRSYEIQDAQHSYTGFRLVMQAPEILTKQVATRRRRR